MRASRFPISRPARASVAADFDVLGAIVLTLANPFVWLIWASAYAIAGGVS